MYNYRLCQALYAFCIDIIEPDVLVFFTGTTHYYTSKIDDVFFKGIDEDSRKKEVVEIERYPDLLKTVHAA